MKNKVREKVIKTPADNEQFHEMAGATRPKFCYICIGSDSSERQ
jgi:hypothetical protein